MTYHYILAVFATGSRDGHIMVWDTRCSRKGKGNNVTVNLINLYVYVDYLIILLPNCIVCLLLPLCLFWDKLHELESFILWKKEIIVPVNLVIR